VSQRLALALSCVVSLAFLVSDAFAQGRQHRRTIIVNPVAGNPVRSGQRLLRSLSRAGGASATSPWLVKVEAGIYDVENTSVLMIPFVDLAGSGQGVTRITGSPSGAAVVMGASDSELRDLTVEHRGGGSAGTALRNDEDGFSVHRVTAVAFDGANTGFANNGHDTRVSELTARVTGVPGGGSGVVNFGDRAEWKGVRAFIQGSGIVYAFFNYTDSNFTDIIAEAESSDAFAGAIRNEGGSPVMRDVRAFAKGTIGQAITNGASSNAQLYDVFARAIATTERAHGINNEFGRPFLKNVDVRADGATSAFGVANLFGATVTMQEVNAVAIGGGTGAGLLTDGSHSIAQNSTFRGDGFSVDNRFDPAALSQLGASQLDGAVNAGAGAVVCVSSYDGSFNPLTATCTP